MGGSRTVNYQPPNIQKDDSFEKYLRYQQEKESLADQRAQEEKEAAINKEAARKASAQLAYGGLRSGIESQMRQGVLSYQDATSQLRDYASKYSLNPPEEDITALTDIYTKELLPGQRSTAIEAAYEEKLGRSATAEEKQKALERFNQGYYKSNDDLKDTLLSSEEYKKKFNQSYIANYYDTMYGQQTTDQAGERTGKRTFKFSPNLLPTYKGEIASRSGVELPQFGESFTGTPAEIEEQTQNIRDTRQYLYSAGLTGLQGAIDKEVQDLRNQGAKDVAKISAQGDIYKSLVGSFNFS
jgi:hypothetical protein